MGDLIINRSGVENNAAISEGRVIAARAGFLRLVCAGAHPVAGNLASAHRPKARE